MSARDPDATILVSHLTPLLGIEKVAVELAGALRATMSLDLVCLAEKPIDALDIRIDARSLGTPLRGWRRVFTLPRAWSFARNTRGPVILAGAWAALPILAVAPRAFASRTIVWEHSFDEFKLANSRSLRILRRVAKLLYRRCGAVVVVSETLAVNIREWCDRPVTVIPNLVPPPNPMPSRVGLDNRIDTIRLLTIGSLTATKNQRLAVEALAYLPANVHLDVLGDGPEKGRLEELALIAGVASRVTFHGYVNDVDSFIERSTAVVHPSLGETFGVVLFEAASAHRPVIALAQSAMGQFIPDLVPGVLSGETGEEFASAILGVLESPITGHVFNDADARRQIQMKDSETVDKWQTTISETWATSR